MRYNVALMIKRTDGQEIRYDTTVNENTEEEAVEAAMDELAQGTKLVKVIFVETSWLKEHFIPYLSIDMEQIQFKLIMDDIINHYI